MDVEEYRLHIHESGEEFNETLTIDEEEQTELFKVPAHRNIEKSDIMFDFKMVSIWTSLSNSVQGLEALALTFLKIEFHFITLQTCFQLVGNIIFVIWWEQPRRI